MMGRFDAIMLDVDKGACGLTAASNGGLYVPCSLGAAHAALRPRGRLAVWSADYDPPFVRRMEEVECKVDVGKARTDPTSGSWNWIFVGSR